MSVDDKELEDFMPATELNWTDGAINRMKNVPFFVRKSVVRGIEQYAKDKGVDLIDDEVVSRARQEREGAAMAKAKAEKQAQEQVKADEPEKKVRRQYVNFAFYKLDPAFRRLPKEERDAAKKEFLDLLEDFDSDSNVIFLSYSMVGIRSEVDILFWRISYEMEAFTSMSTRMYQTKFGQYLMQVNSYFSQTKRSMYQDMFNPEHEEDRTHIIPGKAKYLFIYPFVKTREW
ncbi:uncharacterized protein METZ01_LOCUS471241, partial [marine metagenome]